MQIVVDWTKLKHCIIVTHDVQAVSHFPLLGGDSYEYRHDNSSNTVHYFLYNNKKITASCSESKR